MSISKKTVPLDYFQSRPDSYFHFLTSDGVDQIALVDESDRTRLTVITSKKLVPMLLQSIMFELKRLDNSKSYNITEDIKRIYDDLKTLNSKQLSHKDFLINPKLNLSELLNNSYDYFLIKSSSIDILLIQQKVINSFAASIIKKYTPDHIEKKTYKGSLSQAQVYLLRVAPKLSIFKNLNDDAIISLTSDVKFLRFENEELIFSQGTYGEEIFYILAGSIQLILEKDDKEIPLLRLKPGQILGELAPILKQNRSASAYAINETKLIGFHLNNEGEKNDSNKLIMCNNFIKILSDKLIASNNRI